MAATKTNGRSGIASDVNAWDNGLPSATTSAVLSAGRIMMLDPSATTSAHSFVFGSGSALGVGVLGGSVKVANACTLRFASVGQIQHAGGVDLPVGRR